MFIADNSNNGGGSPEIDCSKLEEAFVYDAETGRLVCVSCERGGEVAQLNSESRFGIGALVSPSWSNTYLPEWISEDGSRVFFDSAEPLVSQDTNGTQDVYEWERDGSYGCKEAEGCVYLLSGGLNESASWLIGTSGSGDDVFIATREQLVPEDGNEHYNLFDVRVGGLQARALPTCEGTGCQGVPAPPPVFATPASVTFDGVGNFLVSIKSLVKVKSTKGRSRKAKRHSRESLKRNRRRVSGKSGRGRHGR